MGKANREVIIIPPKTPMNMPRNGNRQLRMASYSRVSTDFEEQLTSFHAQKAYYTDLILRTPGWTLAGTYADEGRSGASAEKRPDFMRMYRHCKKGRIDMIITKSISRFARNTLDSIGYVRKLKAMGIGVIFEKEGINTLEENSEVILTILASLAQEELVSHSGNVKMGKRMAVQDGKVVFQYKRMYAYRRGPDDEPEIIPEQAEIVRRIFSGYLTGKSVQAIADELIEDGIPSPSKKEVWAEGTIRGILTNEKYCGDVILQKTYVTDPISKKIKKNNGELPKVYIKNNHDAIVSRETFERAQQERARRGSKRKISKYSITEQSRYSSLYALSEILVCGECKTPYRRVVWEKRSGEKQPVWRCISRLDHGLKYCKDSVTLDEESLHAAIMQAISAVQNDRQLLIPVLTSHLERTMQEKEAGSVDIKQIEQRITELKDATMELISESVSRNTVGENEARLKAMSDEIKDLHDMLMQYRQTSGTENTIQNRMDEIKELLLQDTARNEYDDILVRQIIDTIMIIDETTLLITFKWGLEYRQSISPKIRKQKKAA